MYSGIYSFAFLKIFLIIPALKSVRINISLLKNKMHFQMNFSISLLGLLYCCLPLLLGEHTIQTSTIKQAGDFLALFRVAFELELKNKKIGQTINIPRISTRFLGLFVAA